jgi:hypothetical protein
MDQHQYECDDATGMSIEQLFDGIRHAFSEIRGDWTDPRSDIRRGRVFLDELQNRIGTKDKQKETA